MLETFPERTRRVDPNIREDGSRNLPHDYRIIKVKGLDICHVVVPDRLVYIYAR